MFIRRTYPLIGLASFKPTNGWLHDQVGQSFTRGHSVHRAFQGFFRYQSKTWPGYHSGRRIQLLVQPCKLGRSGRSRRSTVVCLRHAPLSPNAQGCQRKRAAGAAHYQRGPNGAARVRWSRWTLRFRTKNDVRPWPCSSSTLCRWFIKRDSLSLTYSSTFGSPHLRFFLTPAQSVKTRGLKISDGFLASLIWGFSFRAVISGDSKVHLLCILWKAIISTLGRGQELERQELERHERERGEDEELKRQELERQKLEKQKQEKLDQEEKAKQQQTRKDY